MKKLNSENDVLYKIYKRKKKHLKNFEEEIWTTKSNKSIKIKDLNLEHLKNIITKLRNQFDMIKKPTLIYPNLQGDMAQMGAEQEYDRNVSEYYEFKNRIELFECYYTFKNLFR